MEEFLEQINERITKLQEEPTDVNIGKVVELNLVKIRLQQLILFGYNQRSEQLNTAWKALEWAGFERGNEFDDDDISKMLGIF